MATVKQLVGQRIRSTRLSKRITHKEVAEYLGLTRASVINIEQGKQGLTLENLYKLCSLFQCKPIDLLPDSVGDKPMTVNYERSVVYGVFGLEVASYDSHALGLRRVGHFDTLKEAEDYTIAAMANGGIEINEPPVGRFLKAIVLPVFSI